jgi:RHS repeat-associated protein
MAMKDSHRWKQWVALVGLFGASSLSAQEVGVTAGSFEVGAAGNAQYSVPITVPPGAGGIEPKLAIRYDAHGGDGHLGLRFSLAGLSSITRCPGTFSQDGSAVPVRFTSTDRYCLDGQRLVSFQNGAVGAEYRTEIESFQRIRSVGGTAGNPDHFVVQTKSGLTMTFGDSDNSRLIHEGNGARYAWMLSRVEDSAGNYMRYTYNLGYSSTISQGELRITNIHYAANDAAGVSAPSEVQFHYTYRNAVPLSGYYLGTTVRRTRLLSRIDIKHQGAVRRSYHLQYEQKSRAREILTEVKECLDLQGFQCMPPTNFLWVTKEGSLSGVSSGELPVTASDYKFFSGDPKANGKQELIGISTKNNQLSVITAALSSSGSWTYSSVRQLGSLAALSWKRNVADVNGDGRTDLVLHANGSEYQYYDGQHDVYRDYVYIRTHLGTASGFSAAISSEFSNLRYVYRACYSNCYSVQSTPGAELLDAVEMTADMIDSTLDNTIQPGTLSSETTSSQTSSTSSGSTVPLIRFATESYFADSRGTGLQDLMLIAGDQASSVHYQHFLSEGDGRFSVQYYGSTYFSQRPRALHYADMTGDGVPDLAVSHHTDIAAIMAVLPGQGNGRLGASISTQASGSFSGIYDQVAVDINRDGSSDLLYLQHSGSSLNGRAYLSQGNGRFKTSPVSWRLPFNHSSGGSFRPQLGDFNGDGIIDVVYARTEAGAYILNPYFGDGSGSFTAQPQLNGGGYYAAKPEFVAVDLIGDTQMQLVGIARSSSSSTRTAIGVGRYSEASGTVQGGGIAKSYDLSTETNNPLTPIEWLVGGIVNGLDAEIIIRYRRLTDGGNYLPGSCGGYPIRTLCAPFVVVAEHESSNGQHGRRRISYRYGALKADLQGRGLQGFAWMEVKDHATNVTERTEYFQHFPLTGQVKRVDVTPEGYAATQVTTTSYSYYTTLNSTPRSYFVAPTTIREYRYELASYPKLINQKRTTFVYSPSDRAHGNLTSSTVLVDDDQGTQFVTASQFEYQDNPAQWHLGRMTRSTVTRSAPGVPSITRTSAFEYDPITGLLLAEIIEPDDALLKQVTRHLRDGFGNIKQTTVSVPPPEDTTQKTPITRSTSFGYDPSGRFQTSVSNPLGHTIMRQFRDWDGALVQETDPNGLITTYTYDGWGRRLRTTFNQHGVNRWTSESRRWCKDAPVLCGAYRTPAVHGVYFLQTTGSDGREDIVVYDQLEREVRRAARDPLGRWVEQYTQYDRRGWISAQSAPRFEGGPLYWNTQAHDALGRVIESKLASGAVSTTSYDRLTVTVTDALGRSESQVVDLLGNVIQVTDAQGGVLTHRYNAYDQLIETTGPTGVVTQMEYDVRGFKTAMTDPSMGVWRYTHNGYGELLAQTDAKGVTTTLVYDALGRLIRRKEPEGETVWTFDSLRKGSLTRVVGRGYVIDYGYTDFGAVKSISRKVRRAPTPTGTSTSLPPYDSYGATSWNQKLLTYTYDGQGRIQDLVYPSGLTVRHAYTSRGALQTLTRVSDSHVYWQAQDWDLWGKTFESKLGNGLTTQWYRDDKVGHLESIVTGSGAIQSLNYQWDLIGRLEWREDARSGIRETFVYDGLDRLTTATLTGVPGVSSSTLSLGYDAAGNITRKSDVGSYQYDPQRPFAVTQAGTRSYTYDPNGNLRSGDGRSLAWTSYNLPYRIHKGSAHADFLYGPDRERLREVSYSTEEGGRVVYRFGAEYEELQRSSGIEARHHLLSPDGLIAIESHLGTQKRVEYLHHDHLGSVDTVTNASAQVLQRYAYDAFGARRGASWGTGYSSFNFLVRFGFTGHAMIDAVGLIHMNGRVFDPKLARFISADPFVQFPHHTQAHNRYSYLLNNPLNATDPSGFFLKKLFKGIKRALRSVIRALGPQISQALVLGAGAYCGAGCAAFAQYQVSRAFGASPTQALRDAIISGGATWAFPPTDSGGILPSFNDTARASIILRRVDRGSSPSLAPSTLTAGGLAGPQSNTITGMLANGGTSSEVGNGKFANGVETEAYKNAQGEKNAEGSDAYYYQDEFIELAAEMRYLGKFDNNNRRTFRGKVVGFIADMAGLMRPSASVEFGTGYFRRIRTIQVKRQWYARSTQKPLGNEIVGAPYEVIDLDGTFSPGYVYEGNGLYSRPLTIVNGAPVEWEIIKVGQ